VPEYRHVIAPVVPGRLHLASRQSCSACGLSANPARPDEVRATWRQEVGRWPKARRNADPQRVAQQCVVRRSVAEGSAARRCAALLVERKNSASDAQCPRMDPISSVGRRNAERLPARKCVAPAPAPAPKYEVGRPAPRVLTRAAVLVRLVPRRAKAPSQIQRPSRCRRKCGSLLGPFSPPLNHSPDCEDILECLLASPAALMSINQDYADPASRADTVQNNPASPGSVKPGRSAGLNADALPSEDQAQPFLMAICFSCFCASGVFGKLTFNTPSLKAASIFSASTPSGTVKERWKAP
jgi:hypothetical protein